MQRTSGSASHASTMAGEPLHQLGRERVARVGPVEARDRDSAVALGKYDVHGHIIALMPVAARPMISFWIWDVPSYRVVTRASRR